MSEQILLANMIFFAATEMIYIDGFPISNTRTNWLKGQFRADNYLEIKHGI